MTDRERSAEHVTSELERLTAELGRVRRALRVATLCWHPLWAAVLVLVAFPGHTVADGVGQISGLLLGAVAVQILPWCVCRRGRAGMVRVLGQAPIAVLADLAIHPAETVSVAARRALVDRLANASEDAARTLTCEHMRTIAALACGQGHEPARQAARAAMEFIARVGDAECLPALERAASAEATAPADKQIRAEARQCLSDLRARLALTVGTATLLRPAAAPPDGRTLLRPVGHVETDEALLVRPTAGDGPAPRATLSNDRP